jgi:hypothetical protein
VNAPCDTTETEKKSSWISRAFSDEKGIPSASRILFAIVVVYVLGLATGALCFQRILTPDIKDLAETVLWAVAAAYGIPKSLAAGGTK